MVPVDPFVRKNWLITKQFLLLANTKTNVRCSKQYVACAFGVNNFGCKLKRWIRGRNIPRTIHSSSCTVPAQSTDEESTGATVDKSAGAAVGESAVASINNPVGASEINSEDKVFSLTF